MRCAIVDASAGDIEHVAANLRPEHAREIRDIVSMDPAEASRLSAATSSRVFALKAGDLCLCVAGVSRRNLLSDVGSVWMLATPDIDGYALEAALRLRELFARAHDLSGAPVLEQYLPAWYSKGVKWLLWLGWRADGTREIRGRPHIRMIHHERERA